jgi:UDP-N-acetylglucosamine 4,6-dehydratase/5-epimerase
MFENKSVLITGGTGSFGKKFTETILKKYKPKKVVIFSRDELKQFEMRHLFSEEKYPCLRYFIGDVRDRERLYRAFDGIDIVIHAAALKQVPAAEYNPIEAVKTNIMGAQNIIEAAIDRGVQKVIALSTDKAANPINLYGATKLVSDKLFVAGNHYAAGHKTRFSVVRYGNVIGSRGSVIPFFIREREKGILPITDSRMTRFWITLDQGVQFVFSALEKMIGGELFVPKIPSMKIIDLARVIGPDCQLKDVGIRPGEKLHEVMIPFDEARNTLEYANYYVIQPTVNWWDSDVFIKTNSGTPCPNDFIYSSDQNKDWLTQKDLSEIIEKWENAHHDD